MMQKMQAAVVEHFGKPLVIAGVGYPDTRPWPDSGQDRSLRRVPHRPSCRDRRLAAEAQAPIHSGPRSHRPCRRGRRRCHDRQGGRPGRGALALLGLRSLRVLPDGLGDGLRRGGVRRLHQERRLCRVLIADPNYVAHIPAGLDPKQAAPLICAGITTYKGIKETKAKAGEWIVDLRRRRPRTSCHSICQGHGPSGLRRRHR